MNTEHTPGPWHWTGTKRNPNAFCYLNGPDFISVGISLDGFTDNEADARLIAAAPELLAVALRALEYAPNEIEANVCRAAIAKATKN